jgi:hypothetical protein
MLYACKWWELCLDLAYRAFEAVKTSKKLCEHLIKHKLIRQRTCSESQYNEVRTISLVISLPGKQVRRVLFMHATVLEKLSIWWTVFFV